jgi:Reverse transcriptase (RNA-dependent DNA polymerase)
LSRHIIFDEKSFSFKSKSSSSLPIITTSSSLHLAVLQQSFHDIPPSSLPSSSSNSLSPPSTPSQHNTLSTPLLISSHPPFPITRVYVKRQPPLSSQLPTSPSSKSTNTFFTLYTD